MKSADNLFDKHRPRHRSSLFSGRLPLTISLDAYDGPDPSPFLPRNPFEFGSVGIIAIAGYCAVPDLVDRVVDRE